MEEELVEDNANDDMVEYSFTAFEVDLHYEFDAARFFDFSRAEFPLEARQAEAWFDSAGSYPPSPFVARLAPRDQMSMENIGILSSANCVENMQNKLCDSDIEVVLETSSVDMNYPGVTFFNHMVNNSKSKTQTKLLKKPSFLKSSTLMKPTASQLAKQNGPSKTGSSRPNAVSMDKMARSLGSQSMVENQAAKRQKLENGLLRKVVDAVQLQQNNFVHKTPNRDGFLIGKTTQTKARITIPRDPDLETARRALRTRPKHSKEAESGTSTFRRFKALPLNRKILEAPSLLPKKNPPCLTDFQEFKLKTLERALLHNLALSKSAVSCQQPDNLQASHRYTVTSECGNRELTRPGHDVSKPESCESSHGFNALPLNKKILTSKEDIGAFPASEKEINVPKEFDFPTDRRLHHNLPIELFNKLSLASETQPITNFEAQLSRSTGMSTKVSKENRWVCFQQGNEMQVKQPPKLKLSLLGGKTAI